MVMYCWTVHIQVRELQRRFTKIQDQDWIHHFQVRKVTELSSSQKNQIWKMATYSPRIKTNIYKSANVNVKTELRKNKDGSKRKDARHRIIFLESIFRKRAKLFKTTPVCRNRLSNNTDILFGFSRYSDKNRCKHKNEH